MQVGSKENQSKGGVMRRERNEKKAIRLNPFSVSVVRIPKKHTPHDVFIKGTVWTVCEGRGCKNGVGVIFGKSSACAWLAEDLWPWKTFTFSRCWSVSWGRRVVRINFGVRVVWLNILYERVGCNRKSLVIVCALVRKLKVVFVFELWLNYEYI